VSTSNKDRMALAAAVCTVLAFLVVLYDHVDKPSTAIGTPATSVSSSPTASGSPPSAATKASQSTVDAVVPVYLTDIGAIDSSLFKTEVLPANGQEYAHTFYLDPDCGNAGMTHEVPSQQVDFDLKRAYATLTGSVAESDDSRTVSRYQIDLLDRGRSIWFHRLAYGQTLKFKVSVTTVLNLSVRATLLTGSDAQCFFQGKAVFGDLQVR
jgi:hypothetical protein